MNMMRVMTYNMLHAPGDRLEELTEVVREAQPDVVACQEVDDLAGLLVLAQRLDMMPTVGWCNAPESEPAPEHLALLTRWPVVRTAVHTGDREVMFRPVLEAWVQPPSSEPIGFLNLHFRAKAAEIGSNAKLREVRELLKVAGQAEGKHCILGDFNAWAPEEGDLSEDWGSQLPVDHRQAVRGRLIGEILECGYVDTWRKAHPFLAEQAVTLPARGTRVDFILADPLLAKSAKESYIVKTSVSERASDHFPVITVFEL